MLLQIEWGHPQNSWWLLAMPVAGLLLLLYSQWKKKKLRQLADKRLQSNLLVRFQPKRLQVSNLILLLAFALLGIAMLNPQEPRQQDGAALSGLEVVVAMDVSNSMLAKDVSPNRLERSKLIARQLIDTLQGSKAGIVAFAGEAWLQLPLTNDLSAARLLLASVQTESVPLQGTDIARALNTANESLPRSDMSHKAIVLFTDGEALEGDVSEAVTELKKSGVMLIAVGVGSPEGATVTDEDGLAMRNHDGSPVVSQLNEIALQEIASATSGKYIALHANQNALPEMLATLNNLPKQPLANSYMINYYSYSHWLIALAAVLLLAAVGIRQPLLKTTRKVATIASIMFLASGISAYAQDVKADLEKANDLFRQGKMNEAEALYQDILKNDPKAWNAQLHLGNIAYRKGKFDDALKQYDNTLKQNMPADATIAALNNKGLAFVKMNKLPEAVETFKQAIRKDPFDSGLQANLGMALEELAKSKQSPTPPNKPQNMNPRKAEDQLQALQQEEKKIRQQLMKQKRTAPNNGKNW